jgi:hypothetical protein
MEFNAAEREWHEGPARLNKMLEGAKKRGPTPKIQQEILRIQRPPKAQQRFVMQMTDTVLAQRGR